MEDSADKFSLNLVEIKNQMGASQRSVTFSLQGSVAELEKREDYKTVRGAFETCFVL